MFNQANAIALWLRREGIEPDDVTAIELGTGYLLFEVEFEEPEVQREKYEALLKDCGMIVTAGESAKIWPKNLRMLADLPPVRGACSRRGCDCDADEYVIFPTLETEKSYCERHAARARNHFHNPLDAAEG